MKIISLLLPLCLFIQCHGAVVAPVPGTAEQQAMAKAIIHSLLTHVSQKEYADLLDELLKNSWDEKKQAYNLSKLNRLVTEWFGLAAPEEEKKFAAAQMAYKPVPLPNPDNVCYMNGSLQALYAITPLIDFLLQTQPLYEANSIAEKFIEVFRQMRGSQKVSDKALLAAYDAINPPRMNKHNEPIREQGDADEFMRKLLTALRSSKDGFIRTGGKSADFLPETLFSFKQNMETVCYGCNIPRGRIAQAEGLLLPIPRKLWDKPQLQLWQLTDDYFAPELVEGLACAQCGGVKGPAKKQARIVQGPPRLIVTIKRSVLNDDSSTRRLDNKINIPLNWSLEKYIEEGAVGARYRLSAVICHIGTGYAGHYVAYVRDPATNTWFYTNDDKPVAIQTNAEMAQLEKRGFVRKDALPYILVYEKQPK